MLGWLDGKEALAWWAVGLSMLTFVGSLVALPILVVRMPADYFVRGEAAAGSWRTRHPAIRMTVLVIKNVLGFVLVAAGLIMLFAPGQGIVAILIGLSLLDVPGKRALELRIVRNPPLLRAINAIRARARRPPLVLPGRGER